MSWEKLSSRQKSYAQKVKGKLFQAGVDTSVSQVAKYYDDACEWDSNSITLATLCDRTGWTMPDPTVERESIHSMQLPTALLRHVRQVLAKEGSKTSREALELLPEAVAKADLA